MELVLIGWRECERWLVKLCFEIRVIILLFWVSFLIKRLVEILLSILNLHFCGMLVVFKWHPLHELRIMELEDKSFWMVWWLIWIKLEEIFLCFFPIISLLFWSVANYFLLGFCRMVGLPVVLMSIWRRILYHWGVLPLRMEPVIGAR